MDPLSAIASVAGIAAAAGEVAKILGPYLSASSDVPKIAAQLHSESLAAETILSALYKLAGSFSNDNARYAFLIQVDQLMAVLTDGVLIFSELHTLMHTLPPPQPPNSGERFWAQMQWVRKKGTLTALFTRLQAFKTSVNCILSILQSDSQSRAENSQQKLLSAVELILEGNQDLSRRLMGMETAFGAMSQRRSQIISGVNRMSLDASKAPPDTKTSKRASFFEFAFEKDLKSSRVYRRAKRDTIDSSVARTHTWSIFSGISLSNISEISVLALPLYAEDISNPHNYNFGPGTSKPPPLPDLAVLTRSIYHDCVELILQLSQLEWFAELHQEEKTQTLEDQSPLGILIRIFRSGIPFLLLFVELDGSREERWLELIASNLSDNKVARLAVLEFVRACRVYLNFEPSECFTVTDLMRDDSTNHVKVVRLLQIFMGRLVNAGIIQPVPFESISTGLPAEPNGAELAIDEFIHAERLYLKGLENLLETSEQIKTRGILSYDTMEQIFAPVGTLVHAQREFLIHAEMLASRGCSRQTWRTAFSKWSQQSSTCYLALVAVEAESKATVRAAAWSSANLHQEDQALLTDALSGLSLPSQRLEEYDSFLEELAGHRIHASEDIAGAIVALRSVKEPVDSAVSNRQLQEAGMALFERLDADQRTAIEGFGHILMLDYVDIANTGPPVKSLLFLYQKGLVQVTEASPKAPPPRGILRLNRPVAQDRPEIRIILGKNIRSIEHTSRQSSEGCTISWRENSTINFLDFYHSSAARIEQWEKKLKEVKSQAQIQAQAHSRYSYYAREFKLVVLGEDEPGAKNLLEKFMGSGFFDASDPSAESSHRKECIVDKEPVQLTVVFKPDRREEFTSLEFLRQHDLSIGDGYLLVYSVTNLYGFERVREYWQQVLRFKDKDAFPMVLVGDDCLQDSEREITRQEGQTLAKELGCMIVEVDTKSGVNVEEAFFDLVREIRRYKREAWGY